MMRSAVQNHELLSLDFELAEQDVTFLAERLRMDYLRVLKDRNIELHRLFGIGIEPQERGDFLHDDREKASQTIA